MDDKSTAEKKVQSTDIIRQHGNHLISEKSLYLQQHAHNPVDWYPWGTEALSRAKTEDKPIFLSIGYSSCHWCHVMEEQVFTKDDIAEFMNDHFICIKVDREERPDLDATYMEAVQAITGGGGWPMSVFLTPDLAPFYGGTFIPYDQFKLVTSQINDIYIKGRGRIYEIAEELKQVLSQSPPITKTDGLKMATIDAIVANSKLHYDKTWGGFAAKTKFPTPVRWQFLLHYYRKTGDQEIGQMICHTLDMMASGGLHDHIGGGFHRYATEPTWLIPHFEKMLYDNAQLASLYLEASVVFSDSYYAGVARSTLNFIIDEMSGEEGAFYASFDADSDGHEGGYYLWTEDDIIAVAGKDDGPALARLLGITPHGNFEGQNIITRQADLEEAASSTGMDKQALNSLFDKYKQKLRDYRNNRAAPALDRKIIVSWNGLAIASLAQAYGVLGDKRYLDAAEKAAAYIWKVHSRDNNGLYRSSYNGEPQNEGILDDYAFFANGLIELYQASGKLDYLKIALALVEYIRANFGAAENGYYLSDKDVESPLGRKIELFDSVEPSGMAMTLQVLLKLAAIRAETAYYDEIEAHLANHALIIEQAALETACWLDIGLKSLGPFYDVIIVQGASADGSDNLIAEYQKIRPCQAVLIVVPKGGERNEYNKLIPSSADKRAIDGKTTAYVCRYGLCKIPASDPEQLRKQILDGWAK